MSWDIFVQDLPPGVRHVREIPDDFSPRPIGRRADLLSRLRQVVPEADFSDPSCGQLEGDGYSVELNLGEDDVVECLALHVSGDERAQYIVHLILESLQLRALDPSDESGIFSLHEGVSDGFSRWRDYRDAVASGKRP